MRALILFCGTVESAFIMAATTVRTVVGARGTSAWHGYARMVLPGMETIDPEVTGTIVTRPIRCTGKQLCVSAAAAGGSLRVALLGADGLTLDACRPITADVTDGVVKWNGATDISSFQGKDIRLKFELKAAKLYAFVFDDL